MLKVAQHQKRHGEEVVERRLVAEQCLVCALPGVETINAYLLEGEKWQAVARKVAKRHPKVSAEVWHDAVGMHFRRGHYHAS